MAIKGKSKAKGRPKPVARAPRREPVVVKPPLFQRRWLQFTGVFILGVLAMSIAVWIYHGVNENHDQQVAADTASKQQVAARGWQTIVETTFQTVGTTSQPGVPPTMFPEMAAALKAMKGGTTPDTAAATFAKAAEDATAAAKAITTYDVASKISGLGFNREDATTFTDSSFTLITSLNMYANAAKTAAIAANATGDTQTQLIALAETMQADAAGHLQIAWSDFEEALGSANIHETPTGSGLGTGTVPGG